MPLRPSPRAALAAALCLFVEAAVPQAAQVTPLMSRDLAGLAGKEGVMVTVEYPPGGSSARHRHNAHTFVYVLEGSMIMQVDGGKPDTLGAGEVFYESPSDVHAVSRNASDSRPARFLVLFVKEKGAPPTVPVQ